VQISPPENVFAYETSVSRAAFGHDRSPHVLDAAVDVRLCITPCFPQSMTITGSVHKEASLCHSITPGAGASSPCCRARGCEGTEPCGTQPRGSCSSAHADSRPRCSSEAPCTASISGAGLSWSRRTCTSSGSRRGFVWRARGLRRRCHIEHKVHPCRHAGFDAARQSRSREASRCMTLTRVRYPKLLSSHLIFLGGGECPSTLHSRKSFLALNPSRKGGRRGLRFCYNEKYFYL
jgi:hypothetical protein